MGRTRWANPHCHRIESQLTMAVSKVVLVVKNMPASAGDLRDVGSVPG